MTFGMARDLNRRFEKVIYGSYGPLTGNHVIPCGIKLPYYMNLFLFFEVVDKYFHSNNHEGVQELKLL